MAEYPALLRRPIIIGPGEQQVGFSEVAVQRLIAHRRGKAYMTIDFGAHVSAAGGVDLALIRANDFDMTVVPALHQERAAMGRQTPRSGRSRALPRESGSVRHQASGRARLVPDQRRLAESDEIWEKSRQALAMSWSAATRWAFHTWCPIPARTWAKGRMPESSAWPRQSTRSMTEHPDGKAMILIETTAGQGTALGRSFEEIGEISASVDDKSRIGVCLDTCHIFAAGYDIRDAAEYAATMAQFDEMSGFDIPEMPAPERLAKGTRHARRSSRPYWRRRDRLGRIHQCSMNDPRLHGLPGILETPKEAPNFEEDRMNLEH